MVRRSCDAGSRHWSRHPSVEAAASDVDSERPSREDPADDEPAEPANFSLMLRPIRRVACPERHVHFGRAREARTVRPKRREGG